MRKDVFIICLVTVLSLEFTHVNARSADTIVFPDDSRVAGEASDPSNTIASPRDNRPAREAGDPCKDQNFCTVKPKDYPDELFRELFKNHKVFSQPSAGLDNISFENRLADFIEDDNCATEVSYEPLYMVREKREESWRMVIQVPDINFNQNVRLERCLNPGARCFTAFPPRASYETFCKQKYIQWQVLVAKPNNQTEVIRPQLPVCCSCHYRPISPF